MCGAVKLDLWTWHYCGKAFDANLQCRMRPRLFPLIVCGSFADVALMYIFVERGCSWAWHCCWTTVIRFLTAPLSSSALVQVCKRASILISHSVSKYLRVALTATIVEANMSTVLYC